MKIKVEKNKQFPSLSYTFNTNIYTYNSYVFIIGSTTASFRFKLNAHSNGKDSK